VVHHYQIEKSTLLNSRAFGLYLKIASTGTGIESHWQILCMIRHAIGSARRPAPTIVRRTRTTFGDRAFSVAGPVVWTSLPAAVRHADSLHSFKRRLKSYFFSLCFNDWQCNALQVRFRVCRALNSRFYSILYQQWELIQVKSFCLN